MNLRNEKQLLRVIRYTFPLITLFLSILFTTFLYYEQKTTFEKIKESIETKFIAEQKQLIKDQVDNVYNYIVSEQQDTERQLKESLIKRVREAHQIIINIYREYSHKVSEKELTRMIRTAIKDIRFNNNRGYFFVYDKKAVNIIHPLIPRLEGKSLINYKDTKGTFVLQESLELLTGQAESYQEWYWRKAKNDMKEYKKIGFVKNIYELDWFIGTGEYVEDFSQDIQSKVLAQIDKFRYGKKGYIFIFSKDGTYLSHLHRQLLGANFQSSELVKNSQIVMKQMWEKSKDGDFVEYVHKLDPRIDKFYDKISYVKKIPEWDWVIGTGFYQDDMQLLINKQRELLEGRYQDNLRDILIVAGLSTIVFLGLSFYISHIIEARFRNYKGDIQHHIDENQKQSELLAQKSKLAAMGEMMENIAHQWRQPLSVITTASSGVKFQQEMQTINEKVIIDSMDSIGNAANHLSETIDDFRDFFKPDKEKSLFTLQNAFDKTFKLLSSQVKNKDIKVIEEIKHITIKGFERELLQVLLNILNNAIDALKFKEKNRYIFIEVREEDDNVIIVIKDSAGGIPEDIIERVFEPYFTTKHQSQGTGLGLYMSQEIIKRHMNGNISVENCEFTHEDDSFIGACFTITLPKE